MMARTVGISTLSAIGQTIRSLLIEHAPEMHGLGEALPVAAVVRQCSGELPVASDGCRFPEPHTVDLLPEGLVCHDPLALLAEVRPDIACALVADEWVAAPHRDTEVVKDLLGDDAGPDVAEAVVGVGIARV